MLERGSRLTYCLRADLLRDNSDAVALLRQTWGAHSNEVATSPRDERFGRAVGPLEMMDETDGLAALHLRAEIQPDFKNARLRREQIIFPMQRLRENGRWPAEAGARLLAAP